MARAKAAFTEPKHQLAKISGHINKAVEKQERRESLRDLLRDLIKQHGEPGPKETK